MEDGGRGGREGWRREGEEGEVVGGREGAARVWRVSGLDLIYHMRSPLPRTVDLTGPHITQDWTSLDLTCEVHSPG